MFERLDMELKHVEREAENSIVKIGFKLLDNVAKSAEIFFSLEM
jgi:hypothetical protein